MPSNPTLEELRSRGLLPHQAQFARDFCAETGRVLWELVAPVGAGKTYLTDAIVTVLIQRGEGRVLILAPAPVVNQWRHALSESQGRPAPVVVDRRTFLEMESMAGPGKSPWPDPAIVVMSIDVAKRPDMIDRLAEVEWDLVVIDESHLLTGKRRIVAETLMGETSAKRALLLTATPGDPLPQVVRRVWRREDLVDWNGKPLFMVLKREVIVVDYHRTKQEAEVLKELEGITTELMGQTDVQRLQGVLLVRAASSSLFAAEAMLRRLIESWRPIRNRLAHGMGVTFDDLLEPRDLLDSALDEPERLEIPEQVGFDAGTFMSLFAKVNALVEKIADLPVDSKLDALTRKIESDLRTGEKSHICVWSSFVSTVQYLSTSLSVLDAPVLALTGSTAIDSRSKIADDFRENGGILITTDAAAEATALGYVDKCFNYDIPESPEHLEQRWGRFLRVSRTRSFEMVWLRDTSGSLGWEETLFRLLEKWGKIAEVL